MVIDRIDTQKDTLGRVGQEHILDRTHLEYCMMCGFIKVNVAGLKESKCRNCGFYEDCC
jgi:hypothetical protein